MKLATFVPPDGREPMAGMVEDSYVIALPDPIGVVDVLAGAAAATPTDESWPLADVHLLAPIPVPGTIYAIGLNYEKHIAETGAERPEQPIVFVRVRGSAAPPGGQVVCQGVVNRLDYEGELKIVIDPDGALGGYCVA